MKASKLLVHIVPQQDIDLSNRLPVFSPEKKGGTIQVKKRIAIQGLQ